jgi:CelD/BcsL family acetyltransferase involved in cellulose biosynthesis
LEDRDQAVRLLPDAVAASPWNWHVFIGDQLPSAHAVRGAKVLANEPNPVLVTHGLTWTEFVATRSRNFRDQLRRREQRLMAANNVQFRLARDSNRLLEDLDTFFGLHGARWGGASALVGFEEFHREFATLAFDRGWLRLWFLEIDGRPVAGWYGFRFADVEAYYQAGRDPTWDQWSVGWLLLVHTIREALADGVSEYRFLRGGEQFKYRFANEDRRLETVALSRGGVGAAAVRGAAFLRRHHFGPATRWYRAL